MKLVILAGGAGTRLYPLSTEEEPKQFVKIFHGKSLFQKTIERYQDYFDGIQVITLPKYENIVKKQITELKTSAEIVYEPIRKNTLPAIILAALTNNEPIFITPSDHTMETNEQSMKKIQNALKIAEKHEKIITFGIKPTHPATEYGYIQPGEKTIENFYTVKKFHEKPPKDKATEYIKKGFLWNSGTFAISPKHFINEILQHAPQYYKAVHEYITTGNKKHYKNLQELSIDYGLLEKTKNIYTTPLNIKWSDLGSFAAIHQHFKKDQNNNAIIGAARTKNTKNSLIITDAETNVCCIDGYAIIMWKGTTYIGPLSDPRAPKNFVK